MRIMQFIMHSLRNGDSVQNNADAIILHTAICFWAKQIALDGRRKIAYANFSSPLRNKVAQKWGLV